MGKTRQTAVSIIVLVTLLVTGCSRIYLDADYSTEKINSETENDKNSKEKVKITIMSSSILESPEGEVERELVKNFKEEYPNIEVEMIGVPMNNATNTITSLAISGELPDIFVNAQELMPRFYDLDICLNLADYLEKDYLDGFYPYVLEGVTINDEIQYFPRFTLTTAFIYRKDWFEELGLKTPVSWKDFIHVAEQLTQDLDGDDDIDRWGFSMVGSKNISGSTRFINVLRSFGAYEVKYENAEWSTNIDSPQGKAAFEFYGDLYSRYNVVPPGPLEVSYEEAISMMAEERTGMMLTGPHSIGAILKKNPELEGKFGSFVVPMADHHTSTLSIIGYSISKDCEHIEESIQFLKYICEKENLVNWFLKTSRMPARMDAGSDPRIQRPELSGFNQAYNYIEPVPRVSYYAEMSEIIAETYQSILIDSVDLDTAVEAAATRIRQSIEQTPAISMQPYSK